MFGSREPQGVGILEWGGDGNGEISLRATWDQGGRDPITSRRISKYVKGNGREAKGNQKGEEKNKGSRHDCVVTIYKYILNA
jgi:hypothetical protein